MSTALIKQDLAKEIERVLIGGDLSQLKSEERVSYYKAVCDSVGLNSLTKPFEYITLNGKLTLYARKDATDQLRSIHDISIQIVAREVVDDCYVVTSRATKPNGRTDESIGAVPLGQLKGEAKCNAMMKAETKSKRRVTLSISGLGMLDETEIETIPSARIVETQKTAEVRVFGQPKGSANSGSEEVGKGTSSQATESVIEASVVPEEPPTTHTEEEFCTREQQDWLRLEFKNALLPKYHAHADQLRRDWLKLRGFEKSDGKGTSTLIPRKTFKVEAKEAIKHAKGLK